MEFVTCEDCKNLEVSQAKFEDCMSGDKVWHSLPECNQKLDQHGNYHIVDMTALRICIKREAKR